MKQAAVNLLLTQYYLFHITEQPTPGKWNVKQYTVAVINSYDVRSIVVVWDYIRSL